MKQTVEYSLLVALQICGVKALGFLFVLFCLFFFFFSLFSLVRFCIYII